MKTLLITPKGEELPIKPSNGSDFTLEELQKFVGGYIEIVWLRDGRCMIVNEEGKLNDLKYNKIATDLYNKSDDHIVGNVLVSDPKYVK
jgi:hypothetical protein